MERGKKPQKKTKLLAKAPEVEPGEFYQVSFEDRADMVAQAQVGWFSCGSFLP